MAREAGAYPGFRSIKRLRVFTTRRSFGSSRNLPWKEDDVLRYEPKERVLGRLGYRQHYLPVPICTPG